MEGQCNAVGCSDDSGDGSADGSDDDLFRKRTTSSGVFTCDSSQTCYLYTNGALLCLDTSADT